MVKVVRGGPGFVDHEILENGSFTSPFGEILATKMGDVGITDGDGPPALDTPLENGKDE